MFSVVNPYIYHEKIFPSLSAMNIADFTEWICYSTRFYKEEVIYVEELTQEQFISLSHNSFKKTDIPMRYYMYKTSSYFNKFDELTNIKTIETKLISVVLSSKHTLQTNSLLGISLQRNFN